MKRLGFGFAVMAFCLVGCMHSRTVNVTRDQLPAPVKDMLDREVKGGTIRDIRKCGQLTYEAHVTQDGKDYSIRIAEDGSLIQKDGKR